jgi:transcriptional regulator with XRE-family HTH domain
MPTRSLGQLIKSERERRDLSLRGFAETLGISAAYLVDLEKNRRLPNAALLQKISDKLDIPVATFDEFSPDIPISVKSWLDKNPLFKRLLGFLQKSPEPETILANMERALAQPSQRKFPIAIYASELQAIGQESRNWDVETGGDLFGVWRDIPVVYLATQAGPAAKREDTHFRLDVEYLIRLSGTLERDWGLRYFGDWHSHHNLGLKRPSAGDQKRIVNLAGKNHFDAMAEFIVTFPNAPRASKAIEIHPYAYLNLPSEELTDITLIVIEGISPVREALIAASLLPEQGFSKFSDFLINDVVTTKESLGRISGSEGALVEEVTERLLSKAANEFASLTLEGVDVELHRQPFGFILVVPVADERNLAAAFDKIWPHKLLQIDWMDRTSGFSEEINCDLSGASLVAINRASEILGEILKVRKASAK